MKSFSHYASPYIFFFFIRAVQQPVGLPTFNKYAFIVLHSIGEVQILHGALLIWASSSQAQGPRPC